MLSVIKKAMVKLVGTAQPGDVVADKTFYNTSVKEIQTGTFTAQSKTVQPLLSAQTVSPDSGSYLSGVTVNAIKYGNTQSSNDVIDLGSSRAGRYYAVAVNGSGTVQGSNNSSTWTTIKTVTAAGSSSSAQGGHTVGTGTATYRYFRFNFTGYNNGWSSGCYFFVTG